MTQTSTDTRPWPNVITRAAALEDMSVRPGRITCDTCGRDATGRIIDAYAGVFGQEAEILDEHGHYIEVIEPNAWNKRLSDLSRSRNGLRDVGVFYHHGMTLHGTPSDLGSHPVGHPMAIRADAHGLLTATHYGTSDVAQRVFTDLVEGNVSGHSWTGRLLNSDPPRVPRATRGSSLPRVRRLELGLNEYGPTPLPWYADAQMVGQRALLTGPGSAVDALDNVAVADLEPDEMHADIQRRIKQARLKGLIG